MTARNIAKWRACGFLLLTFRRELCLVVFSFLWLGLLVGGQLEAIAANLSSFLPTWFPIANLIFLPVLALLSFIDWPLSKRFEVVIILLFAVSCSLVGLSFNFFPLATVLVVSIAYWELLWLARRWRHSRWKESAARLAP